MHRGEQGLWGGGRQDLPGGDARGPGVAGRELPGGVSSPGPPEMAPGESAGRQPLADRRVPGHEELSRSVFTAVIGGSGEQGLLSAVDIARQIVPDDLFSADVVISRPEQDRWTLAELDELVVAPSWRAPFGDVMVVVIGFGETISRDGWDHLLKTLEEPSEYTRFVVSVEDLSAIPNTAQGRVSLRVYPEEADPDALIQRAVGAGVSPEAAQLVVARCGPLIALAGASFEQEGGPELLLRVFGIELRPAKPAQWAFERDNLVAEAAALLPGTNKAVQRNIVRQLFELYGEEVRRQLRSGDRNFRTGALATIDALEQARIAVDRYTPVSEVLLSLGASLAMIWAAST